MRKFKINEKYLHDIKFALDKFNFRHAIIIEERSIISKVILFLLGAPKQSKISDLYIIQVTDGVSVYTFLCICI